MQFKKTITLLLCAVLLLGSLAGFAEGEDAAAPKLVYGTLSLLNMSEEEYVDIIEARYLVIEQLIEEGYAVLSLEEEEVLEQGVQIPEGKPGEIQVVYYDTIDALLMALNARQIDGILIYQNVARYLCATNDTLQTVMTYNTEQSLNTFAKMAYSGINGNDFSFLMMEDRTGLRDEFNAAIAEMKKDGTLDRLAEEQIEALVNGDEIEPVALPQTDGAETIKVAVTGALPPMDYVAANGEPAGFNTAVLAEIARRTGKNIELVVVDSFGRAAALASGVVDVVFWTRTSDMVQKGLDLPEAELNPIPEELFSSMTEDEQQVLRTVEEMADRSAYVSADMPEGTLCTDPYFSDVFTIVIALDAPGNE
ncbi:MAG: transporter substrate-binding domain-containing protein [Christensenellales bacterium]|nr:transporter substrate-binding domain-containing protein [Christensenellales bacterium]